MPPEGCWFGSAGKKKGIDTALPTRHLRLQFFGVGFVCKPLTPSVKYRVCGIVLRHCASGLQPEDPSSSEGDRTAGAAERPDGLLPIVEQNRRLQTGGTLGRKKTAEPISPAVSKPTTHSRIHAFTHSRTRVHASRREERHGIAVGARTRRADRRHAELLPTMPGRARHSVRAGGGCGNARRTGKRRLASGGGQGTARPTVGGSIGVVAAPGPASVSACSYDRRWPIRLHAISPDRDSLGEEQRTGHLPRLSAKGGPKTQPVEKQRHVPLLRQNIPR